MIALEKEEGEIHLVAESLNDRVAVAGISNICQAGDSFVLLFLLRRRRRLGGMFLTLQVASTMRPSPLTEKLPPSSPLPPSASGRPIMSMSVKSQSRTGSGPASGAPRPRSPETSVAAPSRTRLRKASQSCRRDEGAPASFVGKFAAADPVSRATGRDFGLYAREVGFYRHIAHTVAVRTPRCYVADDDASDGSFDSFRRNP